MNHGVADYHKILQLYVLPEIKLLKYELYH